MRLSRIKVGKETKAGSKMDRHSIIHPKRLVAERTFPAPRRSALLDALLAEHMAASLDHGGLEVFAADVADRDGLWQGYIYQHFTGHKSN